MTLRASGFDAPTRSGFLTNVLNPKIAVFYASLLPTLVPSDGAAYAWLPILVGTHAPFARLVDELFGSARRSRVLITRPRVRMVLDRLTG